MIRYVREEYGCELEFLWQDENAIWRNPTNRKWFGALLRVKGTRIGLAEDEAVEVLDLRFEKGMAREFVASRGAGDCGADDSEVYGVDGAEVQSGAKVILPGYHMNKDNWFTVVLDHVVPTEEVLALIDKSYRIVAAGE